MDASSSGEGRLSLFRRLIAYQGERFPLAVHGPLVAAFAAASLLYGAAIIHAPVPGLRAFFAAFALLLGEFFQLRVADEVKDFETDRKFRPTRPVPRGLVSLAELKNVGNIVRVGQVLAAAALGLAPIAGFLAIWIYEGLMTREFFLGERLRARPLLYLLSHMVMMPLLALTVIAGAATPYFTGVPTEAVAAYAAFAYAAGIVLEIGRKIRAPEDEQPGVETYSSLWGRDGALLRWTAAVLVTAIAAAASALSAGGVRADAALYGSLFAGSMTGLAAAFICGARPRRLAKVVAAGSGLYVLVLFGLLILAAA